MKRLRAASHVSAICVHDEEEHEPKPIAGEAIISVNGEDVERCCLAAHMHKRAA